MRRFFPILHKELSLILRDGYAFALCSVLAIVAACIGGGIWITATQMSSLTQRSEMSRVMFFMLCTALAVAVGVICTAFGAQSLAGERGGRTLDLLLVTRMGRLRIVACKWAAILLTAGLAMLAILPIWSLNLGLGGVSREEFITALLVLTAYGATSAMIGVGVSARCRRANRAQLIAFGIGFALAAGIPLGMIILSEGMNLNFISSGFGAGGGEYQNPADWIFWNISPFLVGAVMAEGVFSGRAQTGIWTPALLNFLAGQLLLFILFAWQARIGLLGEASHGSPRSQPFSPAQAAPAAPARSVSPPPLPSADRIDLTALAAAATAGEQGAEAMHEAEAPAIERKPAPLRPWPARSAVADGTNPVRALERINQGWRSYYALRIVALIISLICAGMMWDGLDSYPRTIDQVKNDLSAFISGFSLHGLILFLPMFAATLLTREREEHTLDILLVTPLSPGRIVRGKFAHAWRQMVVLLLILSLCPVLVTLQYTVGYERQERIDVMLCVARGLVHAAAFLALYIGMALFFSGLHRRGLAAILSSYIGLGLIQLLPIGILLLESVGFFLLGAHRNADGSMAARTLSWPLLVVGPFLNNNISLEGAIQHLGNTSENFYRFEQNWVWLLIRVGVLGLTTRLLLAGAARLLEPGHRRLIPQRTPNRTLPPLNGDGASQGLKA